MPFPRAWLTAAVACAADLELTWFQCKLLQAEAELPPHNATRSRCSGTPGPESLAMPTGRKHDGSEFDRAMGPIPLVPASENL